MIKKADAHMLPHLKMIWQVCFGDDPKGVDFVFDNLLNPAQMLVQTDENDRPVAMLNWKLLRFTSPGQSFSGAYIYGVGTLPEQRGKGISTALMEKAHELLQRQAVQLSCIVPAEKSLFDFYAARGFETWFYHKTVRISREDIPKPSRQGVLSAAALEDLHKQRSQAFGSRALFGDWDAGYLRYTGRECRFYGGEILRFSTEGSQGYLACYPRADGILVKEAAVAAGEIGTLLAALDARYRAKHYELRLPVDFELKEEWAAEILPFAMVKWYDKKNAPDMGCAPWFAFGLD